MSSPTSSDTPRASSSVRSHLTGSVLPRASGVSSLQGRRPSRAAQARRDRGATDPGGPSLLFAYGTLRREGPMHALLEGDTRFLCRATLRARLWDLGAYPALTDARSRRDVVHGELYAIDASRRDALLASLDRYEGAAFERAVREVEGEDGTRHAAFVYLFLGDLRGGRRIASGDYVAELRGGR